MRQYSRAHQLIILVYILKNQADSEILSHSLRVVTSLVTLIPSDNSHIEI